MRVDGGNEVVLRPEVAVHSRDRYARFAGNLGNGQLDQPAGHDPHGGIENSAPRLLGLLRSQLAAVRTPCLIRDTSQVVNI